MKKRLSLKGMLSSDHQSIKTKFVDMQEGEFKSEISLRYKAEITNLAMLILRLQLHVIARDCITKIQLPVGQLRDPVQIDMNAFNRLNREFTRRFIVGGLIKLRKNTSLSDLDALFTQVYSNTQPGKGAVAHPRWLTKEEMQDYVSDGFFKSVHVVDYCIHLWCGKGEHKKLFGWFLEENVLKYPALLKHLRQGTSIDRDSFERTYRRHKKDLEI